MGKAKLAFDYRLQAIQAAKDLFYGDEVIHQIEDAKSEDEISVIMTNARHGNSR